MDTELMSDILDKDDRLVDRVVTSKRANLDVEFNHYVPS